MTIVNVHTQTELAQALAVAATRINLRGDARYSIRDTDSAHVEARDSAHVEAWGSAHVEARDSAHVVAWGSAHVEAWGSAHVEAWDSAHVMARDSAHVEAGSHVPVQRHPGHDGTVSGGVVIDLPDPATIDPAGWVALHGVETVDDHAILFKAVDDAFAPEWETSIRYVPGTVVEAPDFDGEWACDGGLHFGVTPAHARMYHRAATRFVRCAVPLDGLIPLDDKAKAASCRVLAEVDVRGREVSS